MKIYSLRDNDLGSYNIPFYAKTEVEAIRNVSASINDTMLANFPNSFSLYEMGEFNPDIGEFKQKDDQPKSVMPISQILSQKPATAEELRNAIQPTTESHQGPE